MMMKTIFGLIFALFAFDGAEARVGRGIAVSPAGITSIYQNPCSTKPAGQSWCVEDNLASPDYGWTVVTPVAGPYSGSCSAGTYSVTATGALAPCGIYVSDEGTGTLSTCRVAITNSFDPTYFPASNSDACPMSGATLSGSRNNSPDMILMRRGDQFWDPDVQPNPRTGASNTTLNYGLGLNNNRGTNFGRSGLSQEQPLIIMAVGPLANGRAVIQTQFNCLQGAAASTSNVMVMGIDCGNAFKDPNSAYAPGIITAAVATGGSSSTITLSSPLPAYMGAGTGWIVVNLDNPNSNAFNTARQILSIDGSRTVLTMQTSCAACSVAVGDRMQFNQGAGGGFSFADANHPTFFYVEDVRFRFSGIGLQPTTQVRIVIRRSMIENSYAALLRGQGLFMGDTFIVGSTLLFEENLVDHAGWLQLDHDCTPGAVLPAKCNGVASPTAYETVYGAPSNQAQGAYVHEVMGTPSFIRNILTNNTGSGAQLRPGGTFYNNFVARNSNGATGGGILMNNTSTYNVFAQATDGFNSIAPTTASTASGNTVLTFAHVSSFQTVLGTKVFNASNPSSIPSGTTVASFTPTTITLSAPVTGSGVASGDMIYTGVSVAFSYSAASASGATPVTFTGEINGTTLTVTNGNYTTNGVMNGYTVSGPGVIPGTKVVGRISGIGMNGTYIVDQSQTVAAGTAMLVSPVGFGRTTNHQWNIYSDLVPAVNRLGTYSGYGLSVVGSQPRGLGSVFANNFAMNLPLFIEDNTIITNITTTNCGSEARVTFSYPSTDGWQDGDMITITGVGGMTGVDGTWPILMVSGGMCLVGSTPSGTWTAGTGTISGITWANNRHSNVATLATANSRSLATMSSFVPAGTPTIESYAASIGLGATLADFINCARANRRGSRNAACTADAANNYIRAQTDASIALQ